MSDAEFDCHARSGAQLHEHGVAITRDAPQCVADYKLRDFRALVNTCPTDANAAPIAARERLRMRWPAGWKRHHVGHMRFFLASQAALRPLEKRLRLPPPAALCCTPWRV